MKDFNLKSSASNQINGYNLKNKKFYLFIFCLDLNFKYNLIQFKIQHGFVFVRWQPIEWNRFRANKLSTNNKGALQNSSNVNIWYMAFNSHKICFPRTSLLSITFSLPLPYIHVEKSKGQQPVHIPVCENFLSPWVPFTYPYVKINKVLPPENRYACEYFQILRSHIRWPV